MIGKMRNYGRRTGLKYCVLGWIDLTILIFFVSWRFLAIVGFVLIITLYFASHTPRALRYGPWWSWVECKIFSGPTQWPERLKNIFCNLFRASSESNWKIHFVITKRCYHQAVLSPSGVITKRCYHQAVLSPSGAITKISGLILLIDL